MMEFPYVQFRRKYCLNCEEYKYKGGKENPNKICNGYNDDIVKCAQILSLLGKEVER